ncbi:MAG TPA: DUF1801 domain-containing protein [Candidatus Limnocylindrales bacterium]|nr:DUF1801 domain-containing protein [Candidatus Limnocylindrales bacterium]
MEPEAAIEQYVAAVPAGVRDRFDRLRALVLEAAPGGKERISYRMPAIEVDRRIVVWYAAFRDHVSLFPASDGLKAALGDDLTPFLSGRGTIRFDLAGPLPEELVGRIVRARIEENRRA